MAIPKTIDNDIAYVSKTFGFDSAVGAATQAIASAHNEAISLPHGIGLVKVMGRYAGFVAAHATLALPDVNFCLIPEVPFELDGPKGLLANLLERVVDRGHAVILVAEGAGQGLFVEGEPERDASGNVRLHDVGTFLKAKIAEYFGAKGIAHNLKYIDPSYMVRSVPANPVDRIFCGFLGQTAVHAGMAGKDRPHGQLLEHGLCPRSLKGLHRRVQEGRSPGLALALGQGGHGPERDGQQRRMTGSLPGGPSGGRPKAEKDRPGGAAMDKRRLFCYLRNGV